MLGFYSSDGLFCLMLHEASASLEAELFHPNMASSFLHWQPGESLWAGGVCWYECLRHSCLGRNLSPRLYFDSLLAFVSSEYYHGANHSLTFTFSLLRNFQPGRKQYLLLTLSGSSNCLLGSSAPLLLLCRVRPLHALHTTEHGTQGKRMKTHISPKESPCHTLKKILSLNIVCRSSWLINT